MSPEDVGVVAWSIDRHDAIRAMHVAARELGAGVVQVGFFTEHATQSADASEIRGAAESLGLRIAATFAAFENEDYASIERIAETGGYLPDAHWESRLAMTRRVAEITAEIGAPTMAVHIGTVPKDRASKAWSTLVERGRFVADILADRGLSLLLETGRESAETLRLFIDELDRPNIGVNFDPANFVVYGTDEPVSALRPLKGRIGLVHIKDGLRSSEPGEIFGKPAMPGTGDASIPRIVSKLRHSGYSGPLLLEYGGGGADTATIAAGIQYLRSMLDTTHP